ncbi:hypothetical protein AYL99_11776 [Fonsecaea erecta]|uniref:Inhibitor of growth protein N-terminal histone-binding domain-containing protein n=1 Tax=Fonsecaea erecta TaxID=1367422 RepID=A0A178Z3I8_9EURO|nr:hypothetical protein AYL99_11776 [Fonsecaea erecta]OAP54016.1 hypothetical protein AYL99_11776 [Fonsecaea erecta]
MASSSHLNVNDAQAVVAGFPHCIEHMSSNFKRLLSNKKHLASDIKRAHRLICEYDQIYKNFADALIDLIKPFGLPPALPNQSQPDHKDIRILLSALMHRAPGVPEQEYAAASRLFNVVYTYHNKVRIITAKLKAVESSLKEAIPKPSPSTQGSGSRREKKLKFRAPARGTH